MLVLLSVVVPLTLDKYKEKTILMSRSSSQEVLVIKGKLLDKREENGDMVIYYHGAQ